MTTPTIADYLKYANLQMAAEAFLVNPNGTVKEDIATALMVGNNHASRFTPELATDFVSQWEVIDQKPNTGTGFSGTLFKNRDTGELVISFRSTEFLDDAIRDSAATNTLEIFNTGFAWGQLSDMEAWYQELTQKGLLNNQSGDPAKFSVTGYSLGGHLATAFNLLHGGETIYGGASRLDQVVTFNGAGVGQMKQGTLGDALAYFNDLRSHPAKIEAALFTTPELAALYEQIKTRLNFTATTTTAQAKALTETAIAQVISLTVDSFDYYASGIDPLASEKQPLLKALNDMLDMQKEALRIENLKAGGTESDANTSPQKVLPASILAEQLDYRLAVDLAASLTRSASTLSGGLQAVTGKSYGSPMLGNQFDVVGTETTTTVMSAVANSQWHYGANVPLFIEDQPLYRGNMLPSAALASFDNLSLKLLVDQYAQNNFADTHSLVLIVDSLTVQNVLQRLAPDATQASIETILRQASNLRAESIGGTQGKAEGDVLENVVNALADLFLGPDSGIDLNGSADGNTWAKDTASLNDANYSGRDDLYKALAQITKDGGGYSKLAGKLTLQATTGNLAEAAYDDFTAFAALYSLSPFKIALKNTADQTLLDGILETAWGTTWSDWTDDGDKQNPDRTYTDEWLTDRAAFLVRKTYTAGNNFNNDYAHPVNSSTAPLGGGSGVGTPVSTYADEDKYFEDLATGYVHFQQTGTTASTKRFIFGSGEADIEMGGDGADHLYGMSGIDILQGKGGTDYLEGGKDGDVLVGGRGDDILTKGVSIDLVLT